ncbi:polysaccharide deacetylase family protein [Chloroflexia bacterium SDU3-3]|nr:polysaccharide deacetylase family protein [Chloroflexia bacterium SDU3-3]
MTRRFLALALALGLLVLVGAFLMVRQRQLSCAPIPLLSDDILPNAALMPANGSRMPDGWASRASGVELRGQAVSQNPDEWGFDLDGDGRSLQLIGIANEVLTPLVPVAPGRSYCFVGRALADSPAKHSATRLRLVFEWQDGAGQTLAEQPSIWQQASLWRQDAAVDWSTITAAAQAPAQAAALRVHVQPSSDDRVYLDGMHLRATMFGPSQLAAQPPAAPAQVQLAPWPGGAQAALAFTFDWETEMGGLIHTRSTSDDPNAASTPELRAMRMREGVTTTLDLFRPHGFRATYYATGYNFLMGNTEGRSFMGDPTYAWATRQAGWQQDWSRQPWFGDDPRGTVASHPGWYFGDLIAMLQAEKQDIQSHTFAHFSGQYVTSDDWRSDLAAWKEAAAARGVAPARSLAFPWSSSNGMSDDDWRALEEAGIRSVTRTAWSQPKSALFARATPAADGLVEQPRCRPIPGHERILACPDFYLHDGSAAAATRQIDAAIAAGGMIDMWAHTEEVTTPSQLATWAQVVAYAAAQRDAGRLWVAPLSEIADWQQALDMVTLDVRTNNDQTMVITVTNTSSLELSGLALRVPASVRRAEAAGTAMALPGAGLLTLDVAPGQRVEVTLWPE